MKGEQNKQNKKGFTLAELLIVVAIIAVLVAISIPIFTSQLEKSRESVDIANIRAAYAEVMTSALTEDKRTANGVTYSSSDNSWSKEVTMKQSKDDWQTDISGIMIGDHPLDAGVKKAAGKATVKVAVDAAAGTSTVTITYAAVAAGGGSGN